MSNKDQWDTSIFNNSPVIQQLKPFTENFNQYTDWPTIINYLQLFKQYNLDIKPVEQSSITTHFEDQYEPRVYLKKELQTRTCNWHDFFNALIWLKFPQTKKMLNKIHYHQAIKREKGSNRSTLENRVTQFDECGAIIISNNKKLLDLISKHQWQELFINQKKEFEKNINCIIFGHATFEKALNPYIGMTCHCILLNSQTLLDQTKKGNYKEFDEELANIWEKQIFATPDRLKALPLLGIPGYWSKQDMDFYSNTQYFR